MDNKKVIKSLKDAVLTLELNNPGKLNCMGFDMLNELNSAIDEAAGSSNVKLILIKGSGDRAFSTGADLNEFKNLKPAEEVKWIELGNAVYNKIEALGKPVIAFIDGYAIGGGLELALACDLRIGTLKAIFSSPELQHGWLPGWGGMTRLRRLVGEAVAKEIVFLSEKINAEKALQIGLLNRLVENEIDDEFTTIIQHLLSIDSSLFALAKASLADDTRTTAGVDVQYDVMAMQLAQKSNR